MRIMVDVCFWFVKYPENGFYQLQDRILLFLHDATNVNILGLIDGVTTTADDIKDNSLVEVVLSGMHRNVTVFIVAVCYSYAI